MWEVEGGEDDEEGMGALVSRLCVSYDEVDV